MVVMPIEVMIQPDSGSEAASIGNKMSAVRTLEEHKAWLIYRHINNAGIGGHDFNGPVIGDDIFFRSGLQIAKVLGLDTETLD